MSVKAYFTETAILEGELRQQVGRFDKGSVVLLPEASFDFWAVRGKCVSAAAAAERGLLPAPQQAAKGLTKVGAKASGGSKPAVAQGVAETDATQLSSAIPQEGADDDAGKNAQPSGAGVVQGAGEPDRR
jgi:hypothetical protein